MLVDALWDRALAPGKQQAAVRENSFEVDYVLKNFLHRPFIGLVRLAIEPRQKVFVHFIQLPDAFIERIRQLDIGDQIDVVVEILRHRIDL
jgi:hypothetical protein